MKQKKLFEITSFYLKRFGFQPPVIKKSIQSSTKLIVVIPCYNEPDLLSTLQSLIKCSPTQCHVEVIVVINASAKSSQAILDQNKKTFEEATTWINQQSSPSISFHFIRVEDLPPKQAGVGLARKIGMDEALLRFTQIDFDGIIICFDADSTVSPNYLQTFEKILDQQPETNVFTIHFEHQFEEIKSDLLKSGIIHYELFLRYYIQGLKYANYPYAMHTIGSSMAVKASHYALQGGMNRRKAGEDFYFLHKVVPYGRLVEIKEAKVYPSARISDRVPFGTGKAQGDWLNEQSKIITTYDPIIFEDLKQFLERQIHFYGQTLPQIEKDLKNCSDAIQAFLEENNFLDKVAKLKATSTTEIIFHKKFFAWLDGFKVLKLVHFARDQYYPTIHLKKASLVLLKMKNREVDEGIEIEKLLEVYREMDLE